MIFRRYISGFLLLVAVSLSATAQISGVVIDAQTGDTIRYPSATYKGHHIAMSGDAGGKFSIERHDGWLLTISAWAIRVRITRLGPVRQPFSTSN